jgi:hypothetical protein
MSKNRTAEIRLLAPQLAPLHPEQAREAVALLGELLLDAAANGRALPRAGAIAGVVRFPKTRPSEREAA